MTTRYVGAGGNDSNDGLSWAQRKLTLNGVEDTPVEAGDTVYVGAGTYREMLTVDVSGSSGSPITYIGDYTGANTDGVGGVVRVTGSDNDIGIARNSQVIILNGKSYRTFTGFVFDMGGASNGLFHGNGSSNIVLSKSYIGVDGPPSGLSVFCQGNATNWTIENCFLQGRILFQHTSTVDNAGHVVSNCIFNTITRTTGVDVVRIGGITVKNCTFNNGGMYGVSISTSPAAEQLVTVNNCVFYGTGYPLNSTSTAFMVEDYNTIYYAITARTNVNTGAHSVAYPALFDTRWFFELVNGGSILSPFDLASYSQIINVAGTSPTTADMRGTTVQGTQREWGALEYDSTLDIEAGSGGGGAVSIQPLSGRISL